MDVVQDPFQTDSRPRRQAAHLCQSRRVLLETSVNTAASRKAEMSRTQEFICHVIQSNSALLPQSNLPGPVTSELLHRSTDSKNVWNPVQFNVGQSLRRSEEELNSMSLTVNIKRSSILPYSILRFPTAESTTPEVPYSSEHSKTSHALSKMPLDNTYSL